MCGRPGAGVYGFFQKIRQRRGHSGLCSCSSSHLYKRVGVYTCNSGTWPGVVSVNRNCCSSVGALSGFWKSWTLRKIIVNVLMVVGPGQDRKPAWKTNVCSKCFQFKYSKIILVN